MTQVSLNDFSLFDPTDEHRMLRETVAGFVKNEVEIQALEHDRKEKFNRKLFQRCGELGFLGITIPETYGGSGMDATAAVIVHEELSMSDPGFALAYLAHSMLCVNNLYVNASDDQRKRFLPKLCSGDAVGAMGLSEPHVGTDVLGMKSIAVKNGNSYALTGRKMWITNGTVDDQRTPADVVLVYAKVDGPSKAGNRKTPMSTFIVEKGMKGFSVGQKIMDKTGMRASNTAELVFDQCEIPQTHRVGEEGESLIHMMRNLELERLTLAAMSVGIARRCVDIMNRYASEREAFGQPLYRFGQIQKHISESYAEMMACRTYLYNTARRMNLNKEGNRLDSDGVKLVASTMGKNVADRAMQVLGGYGYVGEYVAERLWRDAKLLEIGGGTLEAHQKNIAVDLARKIKP